MAGIGFLKNPKNQSNRGRIVVRLRSINTPKMNIEKII